MVQRVSIDSARRGVLKKMIGAAAGLCAVQGARADLQPPGSSRSLAFFNLHTSERLRCSYWSNGRYDHAALEDIAFVLRDFRTDEVKAIDTQLLNLLAMIRAQLSSTREFQVISGYRSPKTNAMLNARSSGVAKRSLHMQGQAIDVCLQGTRLPVLRQAGLKLKQGGVGYYPKSGFVHFDVGRPRAWVGS